MNELLTAAQMRAIEGRAIASGTVTGRDLMERAGRGVVEEVLKKWPELAEGGHRAVVLCGPGHNGGDGFVVARLLYERGWDVDLFLQGDAARLPPDTRLNHDRWVRLGAVRPFALAPTHAEGADLFVDALFGTGLSRPLDAEVRAWIEACKGDPRIAARTVAVDMPSGLCSDSGRPLGADGATVEAALTVTFHRAKHGHLLGDGPARSGRLVICDIGLSGGCDGAVGLVGGPTGALSKGDAGHKFSHGHAFVLSGPAGRGGAARLAARGALRIGAGLVTVGSPPDAMPENAARLDAVMVRPLADADALAEGLRDARITALCLGPALGTGPREAGLVAAALGAKRATVLDADALTLLSRDAGLFARLHDGCVLTPHAGEFARLFPDISTKLEAAPMTGPAYSKVDAAREAAARAGCVLLLKGPDTVIAGPDGRCAVNSAHYDRVTPWLATAGSGDVLAGFIAGLLARGFSPFDAACTGAWLHVECALEFGPGLIAEDLPDVLPGVFRRLGV